MSDEKRVKVEVLGERGLNDAGYVLAQGDQVTVPEDLARYWCSHGWTSALDGSIETGERKIVRASVQPVRADHKQTGREV